MLRIIIIYLLFIAWRCVATSGKQAAIGSLTHNSRNFHIHHLALVTKDLRNISTNHNLLVRITRKHALVRTHNKIKTNFIFRFCLATNDSAINLRKKICFSLYSLHSWPSEAPLSFCSLFELSVEVLPSVS